MSLSLYDASIPRFINMLKNLSAFLDKAEAHAASGGPALSELFTASFGHEMLPLKAQVQLASDAAKGGAARLAGVEAPAMPDTEGDFPALKNRIAATIAFLETLKRDQVEGQEDREIVLTFPNFKMEFTGQSFLFDFSMPNFLFHVVTAYDILRANGVPLGKRDYLNRA